MPIQKEGERAPQQVAFGPEVKTATEVALAATVAEISLTLGVGRQIISTATGLPTNERAIEWQASYSLSPPTALALLKALESTIKYYEQEFGKIPVNPIQNISVIRSQPK